MFFNRFISKFHQMKSENVVCFLRFLYNYVTESIEQFVHLD